MRGMGGREPINRLLPILVLAGAATLVVKGLIENTVLTLARMVLVVALLWTVSKLLKYTRGTTHD